MARKPLSEGTVAANVLRWGVGAINVDGCRVGIVGDRRSPAGADGNIHRTTGNTYGAHKPSGEFDTTQSRWPANVIHDGSEEVVAAFPDAGQAKPGRSGAVGGHGGDVRLCASKDADKHIGYWPEDTGGSAARFFYQVKPDNGRDGEASAERRYTDEGATNFAALPGARRDAVPPSRLFYSAKADADDRLGSKHPTVKPVDLMQYLVRLVTPPKGTVLDPFSGTGTTGEAAWREGMRAVLIESEAEYQDDIRRRMALALAGPDERMRESIKARGAPIDYGPLFAAISSEVAE